jgi:hypothetical protein
MMLTTAMAHTTIAATKLIYIKSRNGKSGYFMAIGKVVKKYTIGEQPGDFRYWQSKSYEERLNALEQIRKEYNSWRYNAGQGFQRVYRIIKRK